MTAKRILWAVVAIIVVVWIIYFGSARYDTGRTGNGEVYSNDPPSARSKTSTAESNAGHPIVYPAPSQTDTAATPDPYSQTTAAGQTAQPGANSKAAAEAVPATDSISPEPPNGMVFSGTGQYQLYRQGDITWRLDTHTGRTCIIFATDEEWKKPRVLKAGCGRT